MSSVWTPAMKRRLASGYGAMGGIGAGMSLALAPHALAVWAPVAMLAGAFAGALLFARLFR